MTDFFTGSLLRGQLQILSLAAPVMSSERDLPSRLWVGAAPRSNRLARDMRRDPDRTELEFVVLFFLLVVPLGYWALQALFALLGVG